MSHEHTAFAAEVLSTRLARRSWDQPTGPTVNPELPETLLPTMAFKKNA